MKSNRFIFIEATQLKFLLTGFSLGAAIATAISLGSAKSDRDLRITENPVNPKNRQETLLLSKCSRINDNAQSFSVVRASDGLIYCAIGKP